jgi:hypothetical protein
MNVEHETTNMERDFLLSRGVSNVRSELFQDSQLANVLMMLEKPAISVTRLAVLPNVNVTDFRNIMQLSSYYCLGSNLSFPTPGHSPRYADVIAPLSPHHAMSRFGSFMHPISGVSWSGCN